MSLPTVETSQVRTTLGEPIIEVSEDELARTRGYVRYAGDGITVAFEIEIKEGVEVLIG